MPIQTTYPTEPAAARAGMLACRRNEAEIDSCFNAEASASIAFGRAVEYASASDEKAVKLPNAETDLIKGIVVLSHCYEQESHGGDIDADGVIPGGNLNILRKGTIWVVCEDGCTPGQRLWVRAVAGGDPEFLGGLNSADDSTDMVDCTTKGEWVTAAAAGGLAKLRVDF